MAPEYSCRSCGRALPCRHCEPPVQGPPRSGGLEGPCYTCPSQCRSDGPPCFGFEGVCEGSFTSSDALEALEAHTRHGSAR